MASSLKALIALLLIVHHVRAITIQCTFQTSQINWGHVGKIYHCVVNNIPQITTRGTVVTSAYGTHASGHSHANVLGINVQSGTVNYIPSGLASIFPNILELHFNDVHLKEINQCDFMPFPKLRVLDLHNNDIQVLSRDLFKYNPEIEMICMGSNNINQVCPGVFDTLSNLKGLSVGGSCLSTSSGSNGVLSVTSRSSCSTGSCPAPSCSFATCDCDKIEKKIEALERKDAEAERKSLALDGKVDALGKKCGVVETKAETIEKAIELIQQTNGQSLVHFTAVDLSLESLAAANSNLTQYCNDLAAKTRKVLSFVKVLSEKLVSDLKN